MTCAPTEEISWDITGVAVDLGQVPPSDHSSKHPQATSLDDLSRLKGADSTGYFVLTVDVDVCSRKPTNDPPGPV